MPFPKLKHISPARYFEPVASHYEVTDNGVVVEVVDKINGSMPPVEDFELDKLIKAGVPLRKVPTQIFKSGISDLARVVEDFEKKSVSVESAPVESAPVESAPEPVPVDSKI